MLKPFSVLFLIALLANPLYAQNEAAIWYFGRNAGLDFNSGAPVALLDGALRTNEGCATISDFNGNLLFYTDGVTIWNRNHLPMLNGTGLNGHPSSTQSGIIVPNPGNPDLYYVFTVDELAGPNGLQYNIVDLTLDGGLGAVTLKNQVLESPVAEKLTAVTHANDTDIWVLAHRMGGNEFVAYLVTPTGLSTTPIVSAIGSDIMTPQQSGGYLKFAPNGSLLASASPGANTVEIFQFDNATGTVDVLFDITPFYTALRPGSLAIRPYGVEFSSDSSKLYITSGAFASATDQNYDLYQFDLSTLNTVSIMASATLLRTQVSDMQALQLAIDGRIYVTQYEQSYLSVINNPNVQGMGADYVQNGVNLGGRLSLLGLPPFIQSFFVVGLQARNFCFGDATEFLVNTSEPVTTIAWDFGDGNTSNLETPTHVYATPGTYTVSVTATTATETRTESKDITIYATPTASATTDFEVCTTETNHTFDLATKDVEVQGGLLASEYSVSYHPTLADAENSTNVLPSLYAPSDPIETITARIRNVNNPACFDTVSFDLIVKTAPLVDIVSDWTVCDTDTDGLFVFDLSEKNNEILNGQDAATFSITYHASQADANTNTNAIGPNYTNTASPETLFFRIENTTYPECFETGNFALEVITGVVANTPDPLEICDDDNDGFFSFDLSQRNLEILGGQSPTSFTVSYHRTQGDADTGNNDLNTNDYTNTAAYNETIYVRVANNGNPDCYNTTALDLRIHDSPLLENVTRFQVCDDDNDGLQTVDLTLKDLEVLGNQSAAGFEITYHLTQADADTGGNAISNPFSNTANPQTLYFRKTNTSAATCFVTGSFELEVYDTPTAESPTDLVACDSGETGVQIFDLSIKDVEVLNGQDPTIFEVGYFANLGDAVLNENPLPKTSYVNSLPEETIYTAVRNRGFEACYELSELQLIVNPLPDPNLEPTYVICPDRPELVIDGGDFESWSWRDAGGTELSTERNLDIAELGDYTLTISQSSNGLRCEKTVAFEVVSSGAPESVTADLSGFSDAITLQVLATGTGNFEYSVDGEVFQDSDRFEVFPGEYTVYVRDKFRCRTLTTEVIALGYQKFFTPNGDNTNERWNIIGGENFPNAQLYIFDRYGKLISQIAPTSSGWDGTLEGRPVPSTDYWFRYVYEDGKVFAGHFALKR